MKINCTYKEMLDYVRNYGEPRDELRGTDPATRLRNTWTFVSMMPELLKKPQDFHITIKDSPDLRGFKKLVFTFDEPINNPVRLAHYLKTFDSYMLKNYPKSYVSIFREYPDWWLLWCFLERAMVYSGEQFQPIVITVQNDIIDLEQPIPADDNVNVETTYGFLSA